MKFDLLKAILMVRWLRKFQTSLPWVSALSVLVICVLGMSAVVGSVRADEADDNLKLIVEAARKLKYSFPENRAFLLVKQETIVSPVAVIFGYVDNKAACVALSEKLSNPVTIGTFNCSPIF